MRVVYMCECGCVCVCVCVCARMRVEASMCGSASVCLYMCVNNMTSLLRLQMLLYYVFCNQPSGSALSTLTVRDHIYHTGFGLIQDTI